MEAPPPVPNAPEPAPTRSQEVIDTEHLRLLAIFHYIVGGLTCLFALFPLLHVIMGLIMLNNPDAFSPPEGEAEQEDFRAFAGWLFVIIGGTFIVIGQTIGILIAVAGRNLQRWRNYMFCLVIACLECVMVPFGTVLGVFTIIVLNRESVKRRFETT